MMMHHIKYWHRRSASGLSLKQYAVVWASSSTGRGTCSSSSSRSKRSSARAWLGNKRMESTLREAQLLLDELIRLRYAELGLDARSPWLVVTAAEQADEVRAGRLVYTEVEIRRAGAT